MTPPIAALVAPPPECDNTQDLPRMFVLLTPTECNTSLTYTQWKEADASMRHRLSLNARAVLGYTAQRIFARFTAVTKLTLSCVGAPGQTASPTTRHAKWPSHCCPSGSPGSSSVASGTSRTTAFTASGWEQELESGDHDERPSIGGGVGEAHEAMDAAGAWRRQGADWGSR
ncbi:hypothetical protein OsJ_14449 [Oryza sativa Japonica Group]|uniref:Uncharacterized protein n=1 Tax=Oryza sativa subsp. japonica TaxID=39947 RepID=B9FEQ0_ORYSJ|nr:hypothetical protein OsJ_14449 [Oryza sativa Japonica Group]